jgi:hypothetical protein
MQAPRANAMAGRLPGSARPGRLALSPVLEAAAGRGDRAVAFEPAPRGVRQRDRVAAPRHPIMITRARSDHLQDTPQRGCAPARRGGALPPDSGHGVVD